MGNSIIEVPDDQLVTVINHLGVMTKMSVGEMREKSLKKTAKIDSNKIPAYVYFISNGSHTKIGKANSIDNRIPQIQTGSSTSLTLLHSVYCSTQEEAFNLEKTLHEKFSACRLKGEWFNIPIEELQREWNELKEN